MLVYYFSEESDYTSIKNIRRFTILSDGLA